VNARPLPSAQRGAPITAGSGADVLVIGGGLIGTSIAWQLGEAGLRVTQVIGERAAAASRVAAGMLAPVTETTFTEQTLLSLNRASLDRYAGFVAAVEEASGRKAGLRRTATISVACDADDLARLNSYADYLARLGLAAESLRASETRRHEPLLAPQVVGGLLVPGDWSCDNRLLWAALIEAARRAGVHEIDGFVHEVRSRADQACGVVLADGTELEADLVVLANGAWAAQVRGVPPLPVRPVKGQIIRLDPRGLPSPGLTVRGLVQGNEVYLVPRPSGREIVLGATVEEKGFDSSVTAGGVYELLRDARAVIPLAGEYALAETSVGWRPGTPDNAPILGESGLPGLLLATGHYRNGVLLTPITAEVIATLVLTGTTPEEARPFGLGRLRRQPVT
jgi:glycine oxidase